MKYFLGLLVCFFADAKVKKKRRNEPLLQQYWFKYR